MARERYNCQDASSRSPGPYNSSERPSFYPQNLMVPRNQFVAPAVAFSAYIIGGLLLLCSRDVAAFFLLSFALTVQIFDAYSFPFLNRITGMKESLLFGSAGKVGETAIPSAILFLSPSPANSSRKRKRSLYRIGFLGGVILFFSAVASLVKITVPHLIPAAGAAFSAAGFFSRGLHEDVKNGSALTLSAYSSVSERLLGDEQFGSWIILLTDPWPQGIAFLARYRKYIITCPCFFLSFDGELSEKECTVDRSLAILTGYSTHPGLSEGLIKIATENGLAVTTRKNGLALTGLCALARGYRAASITFSTSIGEAVLTDSLKKINRLQYKRGESR